MSMNKVKRNKTRFFAVLLCLFLLAGLFPGMGTKVYATDDGAVMTEASNSDSLKIKDKGKEATVEETNLEAEDESSKSISDRLATDSEAIENVINKDSFMPLATPENAESVSYLDENGLQQNAMNVKQITGDDTQWTEGWYVAKGKITINNRVKLLGGDIHLILEDGCNLTINGGIEMTQIGVPPGTVTQNKLYIYAQSVDKDKMGSLLAENNDKPAIGTNSYGLPDLKITGGNVTANSQYRAGISVWKLIITGGVVRSNASFHARIGISVSEAIVSGGILYSHSFNGRTFSAGTNASAMIFMGGWGKLHGDNYTLPYDMNFDYLPINGEFIVEKGQTLTIPKGVSLTVPGGVYLRNEGTILVEEGGNLVIGHNLFAGGITNNGQIINKGKIHNRGKITGNEIEGKQLPQVDNGNLTDATVGRAYSTQLTKTNDGIKWSLKEDSTLPNGLTLDGDTGVISGKPAEAGKFTFTLLAENDGGSEFKTFNITVNPAPIYKINDLRDVKVNEGESLTFSVEVTKDSKSMTEGVKYHWRQSDDGGKTWTVVDTNNRNSYTIASVTKEMNNLQFSCLADIEEHGKLESNAVTLTVEPMPVITSESIPDGKVEEAYSTTLASRGNSTKWSLKEGSQLPKGLTLDKDTGLISGKPIKAGEFTFTILAQSAWGSVEKTLSLKVNPAIKEEDKPVNYVVTVQTEGKGKAGSNPMIATSGTKVILNAKPDAGYVFKGWEVVSGSAKIEDNSFIMPTENVVVKAVFEKEKTAPNKQSNTKVLDKQPNMKVLPKTGEESNIGIWTISMFLSMLFFGIYAVSIRRKKDTNN